MFAGLLHALSRVVLRRLRVGIAVVYGTDSDDGENVWSQGAPPVSHA